MEYTQEIKDAYKMYAEKPIQRRFNAFYKICLDVGLDAWKVASDFTWEDIEGKAVIDNK
ncbi:hypothetical protein [uncultured Clostridium sp.]|uniref:hypothetical protein n=1 Tax=uncultured Clostridium sp. TaxID=59620 RepID=UPI00262FDFA8|nr:hypothetical protein [uncultured Clostridium sp.]